MSPRYNTITQNPGKKIAAVNEDLVDLTDNLKAALDNDPTNASVSEGSGYLDLAKELKQIKDSITDLVKKTDIHESKLPSSLLPVFYTAPLAPEDYTLVSGVQINQGQLSLRDINNKQVDGLGLAYQSGLSNDWSVEFVNAPLSNGVVSNIDNILVFDGSNNDKNNLYATKAYGLDDSFGFEATITYTSSGVGESPLILASTLPNNDGESEYFDASANYPVVAEGDIDKIRLIKTVGSNKVHVYLKNNDNNWSYLNTSDSLTMPLTPGIVHNSHNVSGISLQSDSKGLFFPIEDTSVGFTTVGDNTINNIITPWLTDAIPAGGWAFVVVLTAMTSAQASGDTYASLAKAFKYVIDQEAEANMYYSDPDYNATAIADWLAAGHTLFPTGQLVIVADSASSLNPTTLGDVFDSWLAANIPTLSQTNGWSHYGLNYMVFPDAGAKTAFETQWSSLPALSLDADGQLEGGRKHVTHWNDTDIDGAPVTAAGTGISVGPRSPYFPTVMVKVIDKIDA